MNKKQLHSFVGSLQQVASIRPVRHQQGRADGMLSYEVKNGPLCFRAMADKCLDIAECSYKGINLSFLSKPGLMGRNHFDTHDSEALRSIMGGLLFTCGYENICPPCEDDGVQYPMHGRMRTTPAEHVCADAFWDDDQYTLRLSGEMRESQLFGENIVLRRSISTVYGQKSIRIEDTVENLTFREEPFLLLYHFNMGYPLLQPGAEVVLPSVDVQPRDSVSDCNGWNQVDAPSDNMPEQVFLHTLAVDEKGKTFAALLNNEIELGLKISFDKSVLPKFFEWKSMASGDYVVGLEPANASVRGRLDQKKEGLPTLSAFETRKFTFEITILDGQQELDAVRMEAAKLKTIID